MTSGLAMPAMSYQLSQADPFSVPDWTEIGPRVISWSGKVRGRQHELQRFDAGTVTVTLDNQDNRFSEWNEQGPYYNPLSPGDANCEDGTIGTWVAVSGCSLSLADPPVVLDPGLDVIKVTAS